MSFNLLNLLLAFLAPVLIACAMYLSRLKWTRGAQYLAASLITAAYWALTDVMCAFDEFHYILIDYAPFSIMGWSSIPLFLAFVIEQTDIKRRWARAIIIASLTVAGLMYVCALAPGVGSMMFNGAAKHYYPLGAGLLFSVAPLGAACLLYHALLALAAGAVTFVRLTKLNTLTIMSVILCALLVMTACGLFFMAINHAPTIAATLPMALVGALSLLVHPALSVKQSVTDNRGVVERMLSQSAARRPAADADAIAAGRDPLTGLAGRALFCDLLQQELYRNERTRKHIGVMLVHMDNLEELSSALGDRAGDLLIYEFAQRLKRQMRKTDITGVLERDQFILALPQIQDPRNVMTGLISRMFEAMRSPYSIAEQRVCLTFTIGAAVSPEDGTTVDDLLRNAGTALTYARNDASSAYRYFSEEMNTLTNERLRLATALTGAMEDDGLFTLYQPQLDVTGGQRKFCGLEARLYWRHPDMGARPVEEYMSVAEEFGVIHDMGERYMREALGAFSGLMDTLDAGVRLTLTLALKQLYETGFAAALKALAAEYGVTPHRLTLSIPEAAALSSNKALGGNIAALRSVGARICLDRFGVGQSSLLNMREFTIDALRLDESITQPVLKDAKSVAVVHTIAVMSGGIDTELNVSGVENEAQMTKLMTLGCTRMQGDYFAPFMTAGALGSWIGGHSAP